MLERAGCRALIVDAESEEQLEPILEGLKEPLLIILPERREVEELRKRWPVHTVLGVEDLEPPEAWVPNVVSPDSIAYLLFTSGSTGIPKGVMVAHRNVLPFIDIMVDRYGITETDRFSQVFDMTFDLSVFDMFVAWERGACVCCPSLKTLIKPGKFLQDARLTVWFSVPSTGMFMKRLGVLKPNQYPTLRWSLFCGEPLPVEIAKAWAEAAPRSIVENLYGPTELTIACTLYRWDRQTSEGECALGVVPIGSPYPGMQALVVDESLRAVPPGSEGELIMTGPQLTLGYWQDPERTAAAFIIPSGTDTVYYRTGDRVRRSTDDGPLVYIGRLDQQIKVNGYRVELGEVEAVLREEAGADVAVALGWPLTPSGAGGIAAFLGKVNADTEEIRTRLKARLPNYMVPHELRVLSEFPLNANGKVDRKALFKLLEETSL
jgi:amino acid adenylation domain-containing protein